MTDSISWLHISDIHLTGSTAWRSKRVLESLVSDAQEVARSQGSPQLLILSGDLIQGASGPSDDLLAQFSQVKDFIEAVCVAFDPPIPKENVLLVPGNHDVDRRLVMPADSFYLDKGATFQDICNLGDPNHSTQLERFIERLSSFEEFKQKNAYGGSVQVGPFGSWCTTRTVAGYKVFFAGLNTAWSSCKDSEKGRLWMGHPRQLEFLHAAADGAHLKVAIHHHPSNWMREEEDPALRQKIEADFDLSLHGHEHKFWIEKSGNHICVAAGAGFAGVTESYCYNLCSLNCQTAELTLRSRKYFDSGKWVPNVLPGVTDDVGFFVASLKPTSGLPLPVPLSTNVSPGGATTFLLDKPPYVETMVGRDSTLNLLKTQTRGVIAITGIGGQGKSSVVSYFLSSVSQSDSEFFWDWRDCREEGDRFHTQLLSTIIRLTGRPVDSFTSASTQDLINFYLEISAGAKGVVVFDNVDAYVNIEEEVFTGSLGQFVEQVMRSDSGLLVVLTCRPRIVYAHSRFTEEHLQGLSFQESVELLTKLGCKTIKEHLVREIWELTAGHALWLTLIGSQIARTPDRMGTIISELRKGVGDNRTGKMLRAIWAGLSEKQQVILTSMSIARYPEEPTVIKQLIGREIKSQNQFDRAFKHLLALSLVVERKATGQASTYDLHPLVRTFIRDQIMKDGRRNSLLDQVLAWVSERAASENIDSSATGSEFIKRLIQLPELFVDRGKPEEAIKALATHHDKLIARGSPEEFVRLASLALSEVDWSTSLSTDPRIFDTVVSGLIHTLCEFERVDEALTYLDRYEAACVRGTISEIRYCRCASYTSWILGDFDLAVQHAQRGTDLVKQSGIDTDVSCTNNLALALRDRGSHDLAIDLFCEGQDLNEVLRMASASFPGSSITFGNIGRCYLLGDQLPLALSCLIKSLQELESLQPDSTTVLNKGYASIWIAEALFKAGQTEDARTFARYAHGIWSLRAPIRLQIIRALAEQYKFAMDGPVSAAELKSLRLRTQSLSAQYAKSGIPTGDKKSLGDKKSDVSTE